MKEKDGEHPYGDAGQLILLSLFLLVWVGDSFFLHLSTFPANYLPWYIRLAFSLISWIRAIYLIMSGHAVISHGRRPSHLLTTGAFKYVRHPLYLGTILVYLGLTLSTLSLFSLALWDVICIFYDFIASYEEKLLELKFGEKYRIYQNNTGKWLPKVGKSSFRISS